MHGVLYFDYNRLLCLAPQCSDAKKACYLVTNATPGPGVNCQVVTAHGRLPQLIELAMTCPLLSTRSTIATWPSQYAPWTPGWSTIISPTAGTLETCQPN